MKILFEDLLEKVIEEWEGDHVPVKGDFLNSDATPFPVEILSREWRGPDTVVLRVNARTRVRD